MTEERWPQIKETFLEAVSLAPHDRAAFLTRVCGDDHDLRRVVEDLLQASELPELESPLRSVDLSGSTIGRYVISARVGRGGMGVVYKATDSVLGRTVALKFLAPEITASDEFRMRFIQEAKAAATFDHPNICALYGIEQVAGQTFLVMSYIEGKTLKERIEEGPVSFDDVHRIATEAAEGLREAHRQGIIHRDIKPSNILLGVNGRTVITDFGLAWFAGQESNSRTGPSVGTPAYMSPEQFRGEGAGERSDIWSLGVAVYEMITGRLPFPERSMSSPEPLSKFRPDVDPRLCRVVDRMLAPDPEDRFQSADALLGELKGLRSSAGNLPARRLFWPIATAAALGLVIVLYSSWQETAPATPFETIPITSYTGMEDSSSFSPDGEQIAFSWRSEAVGNSEICVKLVHAVDRRCITSDPRSDFLPSWSPKGDWIAFLRSLSPQRLGVYIISPLGEQERQVTEVATRETLEYLGRIAWTPDGEKLIVSDRDPASGQFRLWSLALESLERIPLTTPPMSSQGDRNPSVSPDGRALVFVRESNLLGDLYMQAISPEFLPTGIPRQLTFENGFTVDPVWIPGKEEILFASAEAVSITNLQLRKVSASGGESGAVPFVTGEGAYAPAVSPDGRRIAFTRYQNDRNIWRLDRANPSAAWTQPRKLSELSSTRDEAFPAMSPDGTRIAFVSNRSGAFDIWVSNSDGSNVVQRTFLGSLSGSVEWSPDGKQIAFDWNPDGNWDVYIVGADQGDPRRLTTSPSDEFVDAWSRDGRFLYFNSNQTGSVQIWKMAPAGNPGPIQVTRNGGYLGAESLDGKDLYYTKEPRTSAIHKLSLSTGIEEIVVPSMRYFGFAVAAQALFYFTTDVPEQIGASLKVFDLANRRTTTIATVTAPVSGGVNVSSNAQTILYSQRDQLGSDLFLVTTD